MGITPFAQGKSQKTTVWWVHHATAVLKGEKKALQNCSFAKRPRVAHMFMTAIGGWWWRLVAFGAGWRPLVVGDWWLVVVGGWWRLAAVGGSRLVVPGGGP